MRRCARKRRKRWLLNRPPYTVERNEKVANLENQLYAVQNVNHDKEKGKVFEIQPMILAPSQNLNGNENCAYLNLQNKLVNHCNNTLVSIRIDHTQNLCADLIDPHVHTSSEKLQVDNHCSIMQDHCYALTDIFDTLHANKFDHVKLITHAEFFTRTSPTECVCYAMLDEFVEIDKMLESVLDILSMKSLNSAYSCKFTFNLIGRHAVNKIYICALCITCDKLTELKMYKMSNISCEPYFPEHEINKIISACCSELSMSFPCSYSRLSEINHVQSSAIHAPKNFQDTSTRIKFERYMSKPLHELSYKNFWNIMNASFPTFDMIDLSKIKYDNRNQMCSRTVQFIRAQVQ